MGCVLFFALARSFSFCCHNLNISRRILDHVGVEYSTRNILESEEIRNGIKVFSDWPTVPQLYVKGSFVGGCDIVSEMFQEGELQDLMSTLLVCCPNAFASLPCVYLFSEDNAIEMRAPAE